MPFAITAGLRLRGVDVLTAQDDGTTKFLDDKLLDRASAVGRTVFTRDADFLREANFRQQHKIPFNGVVYAHQLEVSIGQCVADLELIAKIYEPQDIANRVEFLPL